jgi:hypothetical protein
MNKLLQYLMSKPNVQYRILPGLQKMQGGGGSKASVPTLTSSTQPKSNLGISTNLKSGTYQPTSKVIAQEILKKQQDIANAEAMADRYGVIRQAPPPRSLASKAWAIATNPMTALAYKVQGRDIPDNFELGEKNSLDMAVNMVNPFAVVNAVKSIPGNVARGEFLDAGLNALNILPAVAGARTVGKFVTGAAAPALRRAAQTAGTQLTRLSKAPNVPVQSAPIKSGNIDELRRAYHNAERFLEPDEINTLRVQGYGDPVAYRSVQRPPVREFNMADLQARGWGTDRWNLEDHVNSIFGPPSKYKPQVVNRSGLTKDELLAKAAGKDKDVVSKMSEQDFQETILKPTGEVTPYQPDNMLNKFTGENEIFNMSADEYAEAFNSRLDLLNDIIRRNNKSGVEYTVDKLSPGGKLYFNTPKQFVQNPNRLSEEGARKLAIFNKNPEEFLTNNAGLRKLDDGSWGFREDVDLGTHASKEDAISAFKQRLDREMGPQEISGKTDWSVTISPGQWRGTVEDVANANYYKRIPGLNISGSSDGVFADNVARRGSGAYKSINEYLKTLDLGRVKPGFNSQTTYSRGLWEDAVKKGNAFGYYNNPGTVYGSMKSVLPYVIPAGIGAGALSQQKKYGGSFNLPKMQMAGQNNKTPQRVSINDPRYAELYKNRQVGSYYDGAYSLPDLPEVTVTGKDERIKEGMSKGSGKFYKGLAGVMSAPQVVTMELLTGKQQTPSQAWGFDTKDKSWYHPKSISNFAMDTVLDPLNALGVGIADDIAKTTLKGIGRKIATPNSAPLGNIKSSIDDLKRGYDLKGTGFEEDPFYHNQLFEDRRKSAIERLSTDKGRQRLQDFIDANYKKNPKNFGTENSTLSQWFKSGFKDYTKITPDKVIDDLKKMEFTTGNKDNAFHWFNKGVSKPSVMNIGEGITPYDALHTFEHELGHFFQRNKPSNVDDILSKLKLKKEEDPIKLNVFRSEVPLLEPGYSTTRLDPNYNNFIYPKDYFETGSRGQEKMPFAAEVRENLLQRGVIKDYYDDITPDILRKHKDIYDKTGGLKYTQRLYEIMEDSPENLNILSQALNKMPQVVLPVAGGALAVKSSLNEKKKQGGPIVDPRGQWAHPGKRTMVPTPTGRITMQGVPYPVYGQDETGFGQMMYPGGKYKFPGQMVDEYPMMQQGGLKKGSSSFMRTVKKYENELMNKHIDPVTARALQRAKKAGINTGIHNGPIDAIRHASSAAAMSSVIPSWANFIPGVAVANVGMTNLAGVAHELMSPNSMKEHGSDLYNNFVGSLIGVLPVSEETKHDLILKTYKNNVLSNLGNITSASQKSTLSLPVSQKSSMLKKKKNGGQHGGLDRWFAEKWVDVKTGKDCGRQEGEKRAGYPACRPSKRVSSQTPKTSSEMSSAEKAKFKASKTSSQRIDYNHKRNK